MNDYLVAGYWINMRQVRSFCKMVLECCVNTELQRNYQKVACCAKKVDFQLQNKPQRNKKIIVTVNCCLIKT